MFTQNNDFNHTGNMANVLVSQKRYADEPPEKAHIKNLRGDLGEICNYCAGLGFTNSIRGGTLQCKKCDGTGIEPINTRELFNEVQDLKKLVKDLIEKIDK